MANFEEYKIDFDFGNTPLKKIQKFEVNIIKEYSDGKKENDTCIVNNNLYDPRKTCNEITQQPTFAFNNGALTISNLDTEIKSLKIAYTANLPGDVGAKTPAQIYTISGRGSFTYNVPNYNEYYEYIFYINYILLNDSECAEISTSKYPPANQSCQSPTANQIQIQSNANSISINWNSFTPTPNVKKYLILWGVVGNTPQNIETTNKTYTITGLKGNQEYFIRVFAICSNTYNPNDYKNDTTNEKRIKTLLDVCSKPDNNSIKFSNGIISWTAPNPLPEKYKLKVKVLGSNNQTKDLNYDVVNTQTSKDISSDISGFSSYSLIIELGSECPTSGFGVNYNPPYNICNEIGCTGNQPNLTANIRNNTVVVNYGMNNVIIGASYYLILRDGNGTEVNRNLINSNNSSLGCPTNQEYIFNNIDPTKSYSVTLEGNCNGQVKVLNTATITYQKCPKTEIASLANPSIVAPSTVRINVQNFDKFNQNEKYKIKAIQGTNQFIQEFTPSSKPPIANQTITFDPDLIQKFDYNASTEFQLIDTCGNVIATLKNPASCTDTITLNYSKYDSSGSIGKIELILRATNPSGVLNGLPYVLTYKKGNVDQFAIYTDASIRNGIDHLIIIEDKDFTQTGNTEFKIYDKCGSSVTNGQAKINGNGTPKTTYVYNPCDSFNITTFTDPIPEKDGSSIKFTITANKNLRNTYITWETNDGSPVKAGGTPVKSTPLNQDSTLGSFPYTFPSLPPNTGTIIYKIYDQCGNLKNTITKNNPPPCTPEISNNSIQVNLLKNATTGKPIDNPPVYIWFTGKNLLPFEPTQYRIRITQTGLNPNPTIITKSITTDQYNTQNNLNITLDSFGFDYTKNATFEILSPCDLTTQTVLSNGTYNYTGVEKCSVNDLSKANFSVKITEKNLEVSLTGSNIPLGDYKIKLINNTELLGSFEITSTNGASNIIIPKPNSIKDNTTYTFELYYVCDKIDTRTGKTSESIYNNCILPTLTIKAISIDTTPSGANRLYMDYDLVLGNAKNSFAIYYTAGNFSRTLIVNNTLSAGTNQRYYLDNLYVSYGVTNYFKNPNNYSTYGECKTFKDVNLRIYHDCKHNPTLPPLAEFNFDTKILNEYPPVSYSNIYVKPPGGSPTSVDFTLTLNGTYDPLLAAASVDTITYRVYILKEGGGIVNGSNGVEISYTAFKDSLSIGGTSPITTPVKSYEKLTICTCRCTDTKGDDPQNICGTSTSASASVGVGVPRTGNNCQAINNTD